MHVYEDHPLLGSEHITITLQTHLYRENRPRYLEHSANQSVPQKRDKGSWKRGTARGFRARNRISQVLWGYLSLGFYWREAWDRGWPQIFFPRDAWADPNPYIYSLIMEEKNPLFRFEKWGTIHKHPYGKNISPQRSSELFASITADAQAEFFRRQGKRRIEKEYWAWPTRQRSLKLLRNIAAGAAW